MKRSVTCILPSSILFVAVIAFLQTISPAHALAQDSTNETRGISYEASRSVFDDVQAGISGGDLNALTQHFAPRVVINLRDAENGTFSSKQAYYILQTFLKARPCRGLVFSTFGDSDSNPYASGVAESFYKGNKEPVQVYVELSHDRGKYLITHLTIF